MSQDFFTKLTGAMDPKRQSQQRSADIITRHIELRGTAKQKAREAEKRADWAHLNPLGQKTAKRDALADSFRSVARAKAEVKQMRAEADTGMPKIPALDPNDVAGAIRDQELRAYVRSLPVEQRERYQKLNPEIAAAVARGPAELSGMSQVVHDQLRTNILLTNHGAEFNGIKTDLEAINWAEEAIRLAERELKDAAEFKNGHEFNVWAGSVLADEAT